MVGLDWIGIDWLALDRNYDGIGLVWYAGWLGGWLGG